MKRISNWVILIVVFLAFMVLLIGCGSTSNTNDLSEVSMSDYYRKEDFKSITIGKSTYQDVYNIASPELMQITSYGGFCEYPMQNGGYVRIKFYGKDLIVGVIEEVSLPLEID